MILLPIFFKSALADCTNATVKLFTDSNCESDNQYDDGTAIFYLTSPMVVKGTKKINDKCVNATDNNFTSSFMVECKNKSMIITSFPDDNCSSDSNHTDKYSLEKCLPYWQGTGKFFMQWEIQNGAVI